MEREKIEMPGNFDFLAQDRIGLEGIKVEFKRHVIQFTAWIQSIPEEMLD